MTEIKPRVFLSHSGKGSLVSAVLDKLESALERSGYEPLVDREHIIGGAEVSPVIDKFVRTCDAAVFILTPRALKLRNTWVRDEANQLRQKMIGPNFQALPVFVGVKPKKLSAAWEAAGVPRRLGIKATDPDKIAAAVVAALAPTLDRVRADHLVLVLERKLREIPHDSALERAAAPIGGWVPGMLRLEIARRLLEATPAQIVEVAGGLVLENRDVAKATLRLALPHTWVDRRAAQNVCEAIKGSRMTVLNTRELNTAKAHMVCGWNDYPPWRIEKQGYPVQGELETHGVQEAVQAKLEWSNGRLPRDVKAKAPCEGPRRECIRKRIVVAFDCPRLETEILDTIEAITVKEDAAVMLLAPYENWADIPSDICSRVVLLDPALDRDEELKALTHLTEAERYLDRLLEDDAYYT